MHEAAHEAVEETHTGQPGAPWQVANVRPVITAPWLRVDLADITKPSGLREEHYMVRLPPAVVVVVLDDPGEHVLLAWRHRCVPNAWSYEIPGGLIETGERPADTARRELVEETGYQATSLQHVVTYEPSVGSVSNPHHVFLARGVQRVGEPTEHDEGVFDWVALTEVPALIATGQVGNAGSLIGLLHVLTEHRSSPAPTARIDPPRGADTPQDRRAAVWTVGRAEDLLRRAQPRGSAFLRALIDEGGTATAARLKQRLGTDVLHYMTLTLTAAAKHAIPFEERQSGVHPRFVQTRRDPDNPGNPNVYEYVLPADLVPLFDQALRRLSR